MLGKVYNLWWWNKWNSLQFPLLIKKSIKTREKEIMDTFKCRKPSFPFSNHSPEMALNESIPHRPFTEKQTRFWHHYFLCQKTQQELCRTEVNLPGKRKSKEKGIWGKEVYKREAQNDETLKKTWTIKLIYLQKWNVLQGKKTEDYLADPRNETAHPHSSVTAKENVVKE